VTVDEYMRIQESVKPDWYQALCDSDANKDSSKKRLRKGVERTLNYLDECLEKHNKSEACLDYNCSPFNSDMKIYQTNCGTFWPHRYECHYVLYIIVS